LEDDGDERARSGLNQVGSESKVIGILIMLKIWSLLPESDVSIPHLCNVIIVTV
jgi:hypothetical protein